MDFRIFFLICDIFNVYLLFRYLTLFFDRSGANKKIEFLSYLAFWCLDTYFILSKMPIAVTSINSTAFIFLISLNYKSDLKKRLVSCSLILLILFSVDSFVYFSYGFLEVNFFASNLDVSYSGVVSVQIVSLTVLAVLSRFKNLYSDFNLPGKYWLLFFLLPLISIAILLIIVQMDYSLRAQANFGMIMVLIFDFCIFYLYRSLISFFRNYSDNQLITEQNKSYLKQLEILKNNNDSLLELKHNLKNDMFSVKTLLAEGKAEETAEYLDKYIDVLINKEAFSNTGNFVFDSFLNYKLNLALHKSIKPTLQITLPPGLEIDALDISAILGNLLDNAISAVEKLEGDRWLDVNIKSEKGCLVIRIKNPYDGKITFHDGKIQTSKTDKQNHGIGLKSVERIIEKYDGVMEIETDDNVFHIKILLVLS